VKAVLVRASERDRRQRLEGAVRGTELACWNGVGARVPRGWGIVAVSGDSREGYLRVDGPAGEAVEVRWKKARRRPDLEKVAEEYLRQVQKHGRRRKIEYQAAVEKGSRRGEEGPSDLRFRWQAERKGAGRLFYCRDCRRTVIAQVSCPEHMDIDWQADAILDTVADHGPDPEMVRWGVYGLEFSVPAGFRLVRSRLMSGFMSMNFRGRPGRVIVERWGLADTLLEPEGMLSWHSREYLSELKMFVGDTSALEWREHEALETRGYEGGLRRLQSALRAFGLPGRMEKFASLAWHCPDSNRIVGVRGFGAAPAEWVRRVAATVRCH
jgi:hypothetical protein